MTKIHNFEKNFKRTLERINCSDIDENNKTAILNFKDFLLSEGIGYAKITKYLQELTKIDFLLKKNFVDAKESDIRRVVSEINQSDYSEATKNIKVVKKRGRNKSLNPKQKLTLILIKQLVGKSNRMMAYMIDIFSMMNRVDVSYKSVERLYSDEELYLALSNLFALLLKKKGIEKIDACGDATGFSLTIKKHYASHVQKLKDKSKEQNANEKKRIKTGKLGKQN